MCTWSIWISVLQSAAHQMKFIVGLKSDWMQPTLHMWYEMCSVTFQDNYILNPQLSLPCMHEIWSIPCKYHESCSCVIVLWPLVCSYRNEREGIPVELIHHVDDCVEIPQLGVVRSLNVHVSGAIVIWEYMKQHQQTDWSVHNYSYIALDIACLIRWKYHVR